VHSHLCVRLSSLRVSRPHSQLHNLFLIPRVGRRLNRPSSLLCSPAVNLVVYRPVNPQNNLLGHLLRNLRDSHRLVRPVSRLCNRMDSRPHSRHRSLRCDLVPNHRRNRQCNLVRDPVGNHLRYHRCNHRPNQLFSLLENRQGNQLFSLQVAQLNNHRDDRQDSLLLNHRDNHRFSLQCSHRVSHP
jgi:hypothetical protein